MAHQIAHEDALWPSAIIKVGPQQRRQSKWAGIVNCYQQYWKVETSATKHINILHVVRQSWMALIYNKLAQLQFELSQFGPSQKILSKTLHNVYTYVKDVNTVLQKIFEVISQKQILQSKFERSSTKLSLHNYVRTTGY